LRRIEKKTELDEPPLIINLTTEVRETNDRRARLRQCCIEAISFVIRKNAENPKLRPLKEIEYLNVQRSGELHNRRQGRAALAAEDLRQMSLRKIRFKIEAVQRPVLLDHDLAQPSAE
jgi:hypothetical protein